MCVRANATVAGIWKEMTANESLIFLVATRIEFRSPSFLGKHLHPDQLTGPNLVLITFSLHASELNKHLKHTFRTQDISFYISKADKTFNQFQYLN